MREPPVDRMPFPQTIGRTVIFLLSPTGSPAVLGPAWSVLCGAWASGNWQWKADRLLALILVLFIAEALWSAWRASLVDMNWSDYVSAHPLPARGDPVPQPPYTTPWSPLGRLLGWAGRLRRWMSETLPVERRGALFTLPILPPLILVLAAAVGQQMFILSLAALALSAIEWRVSRHRKAHKSLQAGLEIGLSWLAGHIVFGPLTWVSFTLACCYALAYQGALSLDSRRRSWGLALMYGGQVSALALLIWLRYPLPAVVVGSLCAPQLLLVAGLAENREAWYLRRAAPFIMLSMLVAAWAV